MTTLILDYAWQHPDPAVIKAAGYSGVMRYLSRDATKNITRGERDSLLAQGLAIGLVWETAANRAGSGYAAGLQDAQTANAQASALDYPEDLPLFFAVDYDADPSVVEPYFKGVAAALKHPVGIYGGIRVVDAALAHGLASYGWQTCAWSDGKVSQRAHLYQRLRATVAHPIPKSDENALLVPFPMLGGQHAPASAIPSVGTQPKPKPTSQKGLNVELIDLRHASSTNLIRGRNVAPMQRLLRVTADGKGGPDTRRALGQAQERAGVDVDYIFGPDTAEALLAGK